MNNTPKMKIGIVGVSRDCFPAELTIRRRKALVDAYAKKYDGNAIKYDGNAIKYDGKNSRQPL